MIKEEGIVTSATESTAWIRAVRSSACKACAAKGNCEILSSKNSLHFKVKNTLNVGEGDRVVIGLQTKPLLFLTFMLYVFPIFLLMIGAMAGKNIALVFETDQNLSSMFFGFFLFSVAVFIIKKINNKIEKKSKYKPFLVRTLNTI